jgi:lipoprotein-anchoring transpeptidase ErfK/SrfK
MWLTTLLCVFCSLLSVQVQAHALPSAFLEKMADLGEPLTKHLLIVNVNQQKMQFFNGNFLVATYAISTGKNGTGQETNSLQTPLGIHRIAKKIGAQAPLNTIFSARENTGKTWDGQVTETDLVLTRILWLEGLEKGYNKGKNSAGKNVDSFNRYIYIHGTNEENLLGSPASKGCIRMKNSDLVSLFNQIDPASLVYITLF